MLLRLVREDGTPAKLRDLLEGVPSIEIDGVRCAVTTYEGPDACDEPWETPEDAGTMSLGLTYGVHQKVRGLRSGHSSSLSVKYDCPFARRERARG